MFHSRLATPKYKKDNGINNLISNKQSSLFTNPISRSKSSTSVVQMMTSKLDSYQNSQRYTELNVYHKDHKNRISSAVKLRQQNNQHKGLPKVGIANHYSNSNSNSNLKGKLHLGKVVKPAIILPNQVRHNPWVPPAPINQNLINKKGLMDIINMGIIPKNTDFTELLNHKFQQKKQLIINLNQQKQEVQQVNRNQSDPNFFATNPNLLQKEVKNTQNRAKNQTQSQKSQKQIQLSQNPTPTSIRRKTKKSHSNKKNRKQFVLSIPQQPIILQINNQVIVKNEKYLECLKKMKRNGSQVIMKQHINMVEKFAVKYNLKKFEFHLVLDETKKMSETVIKQHILNAKSLGIHLAMKGNFRKRINELIWLFIQRFRFKKCLKDILKIQKIKRYYKIKKYYEQMTVKRCNYLKFKLGSFAERQRRFIQQSQQKNQVNQRFRVQIHLLSISGQNYQQQMSYYKLQCRNNIQLTRIFNQQPQYLFLLMKQQQCDLTCWLKLLNNLKGYRPQIKPIFSELKNAKIRTHDSIYYGLKSQIINKIKKIGGKKEDICIFPSSFNNTLVKICQSLNSKLYSQSFLKPHLQKLLQEQQQATPQSLQAIKKQLKKDFDQKVKMTAQLTSPICSEAVSLEVIKSKTTINQNQQQNYYTDRQQNLIKKLTIRAKTRELNSFKLVAEYFSNKAKVKQGILLQLDFNTPFSLIIEQKTEQKQFYYKLTELILKNKTINKWIFKLGHSARFSRGLAYLQTDSLKILKQKKKKAQLLQSDIAQVTQIMKIILLDKLQIPQSSLQDSNEYLNNLINLGGYVQAVITDITSQCVFGRITAKGNFQILGTYAKIYTDQGINCGAIYPCQNLSQIHFSQVKQLSAKIYEKLQLFGHITFELLINKKSKKHYFIDILFCLQQYSSLYFMYKSIFNNQNEAEQPIKIVKKMRVNKQKSIDQKLPLQNNKKIDFSQQNTQQKIQIIQNGILNLPRKIIYIPFLDYNGNIYQNFDQFEQACNQKYLKRLNFTEAEGIQFLYLNLKQQKPDVLSLLVFSKSQKKALKYALDGLNFLVESGEGINKFDKKVQRRKYDCLYIHDIIWKLRQIKKSKDLIKQ